jgi:cell wall-associated NlpC family hydrolase
MDDGGSAILGMLTGLRHWGNHPRHTWRRLARLLATLAFILSVATPVWAADGPYYIHATEVNLRAEQNGEIILVFEPDDKVFIIERDGNWSYVSAPGYEAKGWCWSAYIGEGRTGMGSPPDALDDGDGAVEIAPVSTEDKRPAVIFEPGLSNITVEDTAVESGTPVAVQPVGTPAEEPASEDGATQDDEPELRVFSFDPLTDSEPEIQDTARSGDGFIPDDTTNTEQGNASDAATDWRPAAQPPEPEELDSEFYQSFEETPAPVFTPASITTPLILESEFYRPVGGNDMALISGSNVNMREDASLKSKVVGSVNTGDKAYIIGFDDPWYFVSVPARNLKGYVYSQYVAELARVEIRGNEVRLREGPSTSKRIKTELNDGEVFYEFERKGQWVLVASSASGLKGWVHGDYLRKTDKTANRPYSVNGDGVNFRASPNVDAVIIAALDHATEVGVLGRNEKWSFIEYRGQQGWMYSEYLRPLGRGTVVPQSEVGLRLIARAKAMQGTPYVWGGESDGGVDCSGLIYKLLLEEGADNKCLPRRASTQMAGLGSAVDKENLRPGDLVFFSTYKSGASHVGIYLGDGDFIHASSAPGKVCISNMSEGYYKKRFVGARRITEDEIRGMR